jgi:hypothetical protein
LLPHPASPRTSVFRVLRRVQAFFKLMFRRSKNRHTALRLPGIRSFRIVATISFNVKSGCSTISCSKNSACSSSGEVLPPFGMAATLPVSCQRWVQITTTLGLGSYRSAASRRDAPASTSAIARARKSLVYGLGIDCPFRIESMPVDSLIHKPLGIPPIQPDRNML